MAVYGYYCVYIHIPSKTCMAHWRWSCGGRNSIMQQKLCNNGDLDHSALGCFATSSIDHKLNLVETNWSASNYYFNVCQPPPKPYKGNELWLVEPLFGVTVYGLLTVYTYMYI